MAEIKTLLDDVIETELANLRTLPSGNEERAKAIRDLAALHKLRIEEITEPSASGAEDRPVCAHCGGRRGTGVAADVLRHLDETGIQV